MATIDAAPAEAPALHPELAAVYRQKIANIQEELNRPQLRTEAAEAIRSLIDEITLTPENGRREIDLAGISTASWRLRRARQSQSLLETGLCH
jgi:site-specific DNA recombinase